MNISIEQHVSLICEAIATMATKSGHCHDVVRAKLCGAILAEERLIYSIFVIPANAGIQKDQGHGCRPAPA